MHVSTATASAINLSHTELSRCCARTQFSDWVSVFAGGKGTITLKDNSTGDTLLTAVIPLTPGPLVVAGVHPVHHPDLTLSCLRPPSVEPPTAK
jgi:hypothetical protein